MRLFRGIGERSREAEELYRKMQGVEVLDDAQLILVQMHEPLCAHFGVG